jgi:serine/threonine-protein kinase RsbW
MGFDRLCITNDTRHLSTVREFISRMVAQSKLPQKEENKIILAVDEAVTNIIEHAYEHQRDGTIDIEVSFDEKKFQVLIRDSGKSFDPSSIADVDIIEHVKKGKKEGLGIFLMRQIMDEVRYIFKDGVQNELILVKYIEVSEN